MKGALMGAAAAGLARWAGPLGLVIGGGLLAGKLIRRRREDRRAATTITA